MNQPALARRAAPGFARCERCDGMGFARVGPMWERRFPPCTACGGSGQIDLPDMPTPTAALAHDQPDRG